MRSAASSGNQRPAGVEEYARVVGVSPDQLTPRHFAAWPVVVMIDGGDFVRSIQHANPDGSLTFYCAIEEGVVLRVARGEGLLERLEASFVQLRNDLGELQAVLVCDCVLRNLEAAKAGQKAAVGELFGRTARSVSAPTANSSAGVHVNHTLTGIAIGREPRDGERPMPETWARCRPRSSA
jgi:hypothetical protein